MKLDLRKFSEFFFIQNLLANEDQAKTRFVEITMQQHVLFLFLGDIFHQNEIELHIKIICNVFVQL